MTSKRRKNVLLQCSGTSVIYSLHLFCFVGRMVEYIYTYAQWWNRIKNIIRTNAFGFKTKQCKKCIDTYTTTTIILRTQCAHVCFYFKI